MLGKLILPDYESLIENKEWQALRDAFSELDAPDLAEILEDLPVVGAARCWFHLSEGMD